MGVWSASEHRGLRERFSSGGLGSWSSNRKVNCYDLGCFERERALSACQRALLDDLVRRGGCLGGRLVVGGCLGG